MIMINMNINACASGVSDPPPSYDAIYTSVSAYSIRCKRSVFSFLQSKRKRRCAPVLSCIREIVSSPHFTLSYVVSVVKSCAAALSAAEFSDLLQKPNIEDHTALYWAIVNNRREALLEFTKFIPKFSPACFSDMRLACMTVNDHDLFMLLNLGDNVNPKDRSLRRMLGCPRDDIRVYEGGDVDDDYFFVRFVFRMFQKRLRITKKLDVEFVARGRIWVLHFYMREKGKWFVGYGLSKHSSPVHPNAVLGIQANKPPPGSNTPQNLRLDLSTSYTLVPEGSSFHYLDKETMLVFCQLDDWPMDDNSVYVDRYGTLTLRFTMKIN